MDPDKVDTAVRLEVYRFFIDRGRPPVPDELAEALATDQASVENSLRRLAKDHVLVLGRTRRIFGWRVRCPPSPPLSWSRLGAVRKLHLGRAWDRGHARRHGYGHDVVPGLPYTPVNLGHRQSPLVWRGRCALRGSGRRLVGRHRFRLSEYAPLPVGRAHRGPVWAPEHPDRRNAHSGAAVGARPHLVRGSDVAGLAPADSRRDRSPLRRPRADRRFLATERCNRLARTGCNLSHTAQDRFK